MKRYLLFVSSILLLSYELTANTLEKKNLESSLVIYDSNIALVHERKKLELQEGTTDLLYEGVPQSVITNSFDIALPEGVTLYSQSYKDNPLTKTTLFENNIGKKVSLRRLKNAYEHQVLAATLLAHNGKTAIVRTLDYQILTVDSDSIIFENLPDSMTSEASLLWKLQSQKKFNGQVSLNYLIKNINFKANYVLNLDTNSSDLVAWVTLSNSSQKTFKNTKITLLSGELNKTQIQAKKRTFVATESSTIPVQKNYEGYHLYQVPFKIDLEKSEQKQILLLYKKEIPTQREYEVNLTNPLYLHGESTATPTQYVSLAPLGVPLPKGSITTYGELDKQRVYLGESHINHQSKNTSIKIPLGKLADIQVKQTLIKNEDTKEWFSRDLLYSVTNDTEEAKEIKVLVPFNKKNSSTITTEKNYLFTKGNFVTFTLLVAANATEKFDVHFESKK